MPKFTRLPALIFTLAALMSCKEVQLGGPVSNAEVLIDLLNQPGAGFQRQYTSYRGDTSTGITLEQWASMSNYELFFWVGNFNVYSDQLEANELYLVTARHGKDVDADRDLVYDRSPTDVLGQWRAIMPGSELLANARLVSALTEAAYQYVRDQIGFLNDTELLELLDQFARLTVEDVNGDEVVDYADVLRWTRLYTADQYKGDIALIDALADAITNDAQDYVIRAAAESVWLMEEVAPVPPDSKEGTDLSGDIAGNSVWTQEMSPYRIISGFSIAGNLTIEPGATVLGNGHLVIVSGNLDIAGLPRQRVTTRQLNIDVNNFAPGSQAVVLNADIYQGSLRARVDQVKIEDSNWWTSQIDVGVARENPGIQAEIQRNTLFDSQVLFYNRLPIRKEYTANFSNNLFKPSDSNLSRIISQWEGPVANLDIQLNSFHGNMRMLRSTSSAVLDLRNNYWGTASIGDINMAEVIPDNESQGFFPPVRFNPYLSQPDPGTPADIQ